MMSNVSNTEIIQIAEAVARDKGIPKYVVIEAMEQAIQVASRKKYGLDHNINVYINPTTGEIKINRERKVVEIVENPIQEISLKDAQAIDPSLTLEDSIKEPLPPIDIARVAAQSAKQVIMQRVRDAEREKQYEEFKDKVGEIANGSVKRVELGNVIVDLGRGEALLRRNSIIKGEVFKVNDRVRAYIEEVKRDTKGQQILLSRTHDQFLAKLFEQEIPEIYDKVIEIKDVVREPGSKAKVAVYTSDMNLDPVGPCVGVRGSRIQAIIAELGGEKIDIIKWSSDIAKYVVAALSPAQVSKVIMDEDNHKIEVVVPDDQLSIAIGRKGQNVRLASRITKWGIDVMTEAEESKRRSEEFNSSSTLFMDKLGLEEVLAQLLAAEGFGSIEDIAYSSVRELSSIEGIDQELAENIIKRSNDVVLEKNKEISKELVKLGVDDNIINLLNKIVTMDKVLILANAGIKTFEDLAEVSVREFKEILPDSGLEDEYIKKLIDRSKSL